MAESIPIETLKITVTSSGAGQVRKNLEEVAAGLKAVRDSVKGGTDQVGNIVERLKLLISAISDLDGDKVDKLARLGDALSKLKAGTVGSSSEAVFNKIANGIKTISDAANSNCADFLAFALALLPCATSASAFAIAPNTTITSDSTNFSYTPSPNSKIKFSIIYPLSLFPKTPLLWSAFLLGSLRQS